MNHEIKNLLLQALNPKREFEEMKEEGENIRWKNSDVSNHSFYEWPLRLSLKISKDGIIKDIKELIA